MIALIPRSHQDLMLYLSVVLEPAAPSAQPLLWGEVVQIPVQRTPQTGWRGTGD
ncbi:MAG TPA: hypothetical protein VI542_16150 [Candidatus Tectomicrobia bacterium]